MIGILVRLSLLVLVASGIAWLADRPGGVRVEWMGSEIETSLAAAAAGLAILFLVFHGLLRALQILLKVPGETRDFFRLRRQRRGYEALSRGFLAIGAGDLALARRHAEAARRIVPDEPMTQLLDLQAAQAAGDSRRVSGILTQMAEEPRTAILGLRGLHGQALAQGDHLAARAHAEQALRANPGLGWASRALIGSKAAAGEWEDVLRMIDAQHRAGGLSQAEANAKRAVVKTARGLAASLTDPRAAAGLALSALKLDPGLVPAAILLCQAGAQTGQWRKAQKLAARCFGLSPHAGLAEAYARLKPAASPMDRLARIRELRQLFDGGEEGAVAEARAALAAREFSAARAALAPHSEAPRARIASLFAAIAEAEGDAGLAREWLSRALVAPRDPQWTADGHVSEQWLPVSPVTGELGAFQWKVPLSRIGAEPGVPPAPSPAASTPALAEPALAHLPDDPGPGGPEEEAETLRLQKAEKLAGGG